MYWKQYNKKLISSTGSYLERKNRKWFAFYWCPFERKTLEIGDLGGYNKKADGMDFIEKYTFLVDESLLRDRRIKLYGE